MVRVLDAGAVLRALAPELARRLAASAHADWRGALLVAAAGRPWSSASVRARSRCSRGTGSPPVAGAGGADRSSWRRTPSASWPSAAGRGGAGG